jgi:hypothetical protein
MAREPQAAAYPSAGDKGVDIRDYFAAAALTGLLAQRASTVDAHGLGQIASVAYSYADAMLKARPA